MHTQDVILEISENVRETQTDVKYILQHITKLEARVDTLEDEVTALKTEQTRIYAYATGMATAAFFVLDWLKDRLHILAALVAYILLSSCAGQLHVPERPSTGACCFSFRWQRPVEFVINADMPDACKLAAEDAVLLWSDRGVDYINVSYQDGAWVGFHGLPPAGHVSITNGELPEPAMGMTSMSTYHHDRNLLHSADIVMERCSTGVADHELGHALGLRDTAVVGDVMHYTVNGYGPHVPEESLSWVR